jgi:hypothetical protein
MLPTVASAVAASAQATPIGQSPRRREPAVAAGRTAAHPATPSVAASSMRAVSGVPYIQAHADRAHEHDGREDDRDEAGRDVALRVVDEPMY